MDDLPIKSLLISMRTKYPHAFSLDRCQFPSGSVATPSGHAHLAAVVPQGYRGEWIYQTFTENQVNKPATKLRMTLLQNFVPPSHKTMYHIIQSFVRQIQRILQKIRSRLEKIDFHTMEYVLECLRNNTTKVRNIRSYMLTTLYNAPVTCSNYYKAEVNHDFYGK